MKLPVLLLFIILPIVGFILVMRYQRVQLKPTPDSSQEKLTSSDEIEAFCKQKGGTFLYELNEKNKYAECENIDQQSCINAGGIFNECASSCRHLPQAEACNEMCVPVCLF